MSQKLAVPRQYLNMPIEPELKAKIAELAEQDYRSMSDMARKLIREALAARETELETVND